MTEKFWHKKNNKWIISKDESHISHLPDLNVQNLMKLVYTNSPEIIFHLLHRYKNDNIYTNAGKILIAINPFKLTPLYSIETKNNFISLLKQEKITEEPHIYQTVNEAILSPNNRHSFLISGESGSGKTETTKKILEYLALEYSDENNILPKILKYNNILEALGNASTIRNHNSSRFGKFIQIYIKNNSINAQINTYLLEKIRLISPHLCNYHIFYSFGYEKNKIEYNREDWNNNYLQRDKLKEIWCNNLNPSYWEDFEKIIFFIIDLLNNNPIQIGNSIMFEKLLKEKTLKTVTDTLKIPLSEKESNNVKNTVIMKLYDKLFNCIIHFINESLCSEKEMQKNYGILDIFGFEVFEENKFEQLCINYTNEKLQAIFNKFVFEEEMKIFESEGILKNKITFKNNDHIINFFDSKPNGFFPLLDEKSILNADDKDLILTLPSDKNIITKKIETFVINHYADNVEYTWGNFVQSNIEKSSIDLQNFLNDLYSTLPIFSQFPEKKISKRRSSVTINTITNNFRGDLNKLVEELSSSELFFIRCIKPNDENKPDKWEEEKVEDQLNYCGITSALELARQTFPVRMTKKQFLRRYDCIYADKTANEFMEEMKSDEFIEGLTMVFYTMNIQNKLNIELTNAKKKMLSNLVRYIKMNNGRRGYLQNMHLIVDLQCAFRNYISKKELRKRLCAKRIQTNFRRHLAKNIIHNRKTKLIKLQRIIKTWLVEKNARNTFRRIIKMNFMRSRFIVFLKEERQNVEFIIQQKVENEKLKIELHYEKIISDLEEQIKSSGNLASEDKRYDSLSTLYDNLKLEFKKYKNDIKEAQILLGEKMLKIYNENMLLKEENHGLYREIKRLQQKRWYERII